MPFVSKRQMAYMFKHHPLIAERWAREMHKEGKSFSELPKEVKKKTQKKSVKTRQTKSKKEIAKKITEIVGVELNQNQRLFCEFFVFNDSLRNNATWCYAEAYNFKLDELSKDDAKYSGKGKNRKMIEPSTYKKAENSCAAMASKLLRNNKIQDYLVKLRNEMLKDEVVDSELMRVIYQNDDLAPKVAAIKEFNKLRRRTVDDDKLPPGQHTVQFIQINVHDPTKIPGAKITRHISEPETIPSVASVTKS